jgi:N-acyl-D-aspartate/D-glutamate deacylase
MNGALDQETALVTGASRRLGLAIARALAQKGFAVALHTSERSQEQAQAADQAPPAPAVRLLSPGAAATLGAVTDRPDVLAEIMRCPDTHMSFADSGAHLRNMAFYNFPLRMLKRVRDAEAAGRPIMPIERAVWRLTGELADWHGLDAGHLREGGRADLVVIDPARLDDRVERVKLAPFPGLDGFSRLVNDGDAVRQVAIGGALVVDDGRPLEHLGQRRTGRFLDARPV